MSALLLNLLNELGKSDKMRGLPSILSLFLNQYNTFNDVRLYLSYDIKISSKIYVWRFVILFAILLWTDLTS